MGGITITGRCWCPVGGDSLDTLPHVPRVATVLELPVDFWPCVCFAALMAQTGWPLPDLKAGVSPALKMEFWVFSTSHTSTVIHSF